MYRLTKEKYLNDEEQVQLVSTLNKFKDREPRNTALLFLALNSGGRATELLNIKADDLDYSNESVFIRGIKKSDDREIPLPKWLFKMLCALPVADDGRIFGIGYQMLNKIWLDYRPVKKKFHALRHTFAINLYRKTKDIRLLQVAMGHRNWNNTMIYAQYHFKTDELRRAILG